MKECTGNLGSHRSQEHASARWSEEKEGRWSDAAEEGAGAEQIFRSQTWLFARQESV